MANKEIIKEYTNGELTVVWKPKKCIHAAICVKTLPEVYRPEEKPWIQAENASTQALIDQINQCPSGALSYYLNNKSEKTDIAMSEGTKVEVLSNGPLLVHGALEVKGTDGQIETKTRTTAFCRCGASAKKPYCDGEHNKINFVG